MPPGRLVFVLLPRTLFLFSPVFPEYGVSRSANIRYLCFLSGRTVLALVSYVLLYVATCTTVLFTDTHPVPSTRSTNTVGACL